MLTLLLQIIGAIATAVIAIILLKKDWRTKNEAIRKEAVLVTKIIFAVTIVSILNLAVTSFQSQYEISQLEKDKRQLQVTNANLSFNVSKGVTTQPSPDLSAKRDVPARKQPLVSSDEAKDHLTVVSKLEPKKQVKAAKKTETHSIPVNGVKNNIAINKKRTPVNTIR